MILLDNGGLRTRQPSGALVPSAKWLARGLQLVFFGNKIVWSALGKTHALTPNGGPKSTAGKWGVAAGFGSTYGSGTTDRLDGGILPRPRTGWRSIVAHYYANSTGGGGIARIFQDVSGTGLQTGEEIQINAGPYMLYGLYASGTYGAWYANQFMATGRWQSFGVTHNQSTINQTPVLYLDGISISVVVGQSASGSYQSTPCDLCWGNRASDNARCWDGIIGPVLIFDGALTAAEHAELDRNPWQVICDDECAIWGPFDAIGGGNLAAGALAADQATVSGTAARTHVFSATGVLTDSSAAVAAAAARTLAHAATGSPAAESATVSGTSAKTHVFAAAGDPAASASSLAGVAARSGAVVSHAASGSPSCTAASVSGTATRTREHVSTGSLPSTAAAVSGSAARSRVRTANGAAIAAGAVVAGSASRIATPVTHAASGSLVSVACAVSGSGVHSGQAQIVEGLARSVFARVQRQEVFARPRTPRVFAKLR